MKTPALFERSLLVRGAADTLQRLAVAFDVKAADIQHWDAERDFGYLRTHSPTLIYQGVAGDFNFLIEPALWNMTEAAFCKTLQELSRVDLAIALPDERAQSPFAYQLFLEGVESQITVMDDEDRDANFIWGNDALRARVLNLPVLQERFSAR